MNEKKYFKLTPFKMQVLQSFPFIDADFDALTNYELLCKVVEYLNLTIDNVNNIEDNVDELNTSFITLKNYVDNYFDNLDIQDEIDNKLDEMALSGELTDIIAQYLGLAGVFGYNTIADMSDAINLADGSICRCLGQNTYNDGKGAFYKVRTITIDDTIDGFNIVALDSGDTLIAERLHDYYINSLNSQVSSINNSLSLLTNKKYLLVGDSYATGYQGSGQPTIEGFYTKVVNDLGLTAQIVASNGYGFMGIDGTHKWITLLQNTTIPNKNTFTDIIILGGMNDRANDNVFETNMNELFTYLNTNFPNATIHVGCVGRYRATATASNITAMHRVSNIYKYYATKKGHKYIDGSELILHNMSWFLDDNIHPNNYGQLQLAYGLEQYLLNGEINTLTSISNLQDFQEDTLTPVDNVTLSGFSAYSYITKDVVNFYLGGNFNFVENITLSNLTDIVVGKLTNSYVCGSSGYQGLDAVITGYVYSTNLVNNSHYVKVTFRLYNDNENNIHLKAFSVMDNGNVNNNLTINQISFPYGMIKMSASTRYC